MAFKFGGKKAAPFGKKPAAGAKKPAAKGGSSAPIRRIPGEEEPGAKGAPAAKGTPAKGASRSTSPAGPNKAAPEPKLSPEAEAARARQGAVQVTVVTGPPVSLPLDARASYQVTEAVDSTDLISLGQARLRGEGAG